MKSNMLLNFFKKSQLCWNIVGKLSKYLPERFFKRLPNEIIIEPTNYCNLKCPVCPTNVAMKRKRGFMKFELFKMIIDDFKTYNQKPKINFGFSGEPLLHKFIDKFIKYASENGHYTILSTNCTLLNEKMSEKILQSGLDLIYLAIDGYSKKSHESYRIGSNFENVKKNIENFLEIKTNLALNKPVVVIQTLLTSYSEKEVPDLITWAKNIGADYIFFKSFSLGSYVSNEIKEKYSYLLPKNEKYRRKTSNIYKTICLSPINQAVVFWDGDLGLCCVDFNKIVNLPNISEKGFIRTYMSKKVIMAKKLAFLKEYDLCKKCSAGNADYWGVKISLKDDNKSMVKI